MKNEIFISVSSALVTALFMYLISVGDSKVTKLQLDAIIDDLKVDDNFNDALLVKFKNDPDFKGEDGMPGISAPYKKGNSYCSAFGDGYQICWGFNVLVETSHTRQFDFSFVNKFAEVPIITNSINAKGPGYLYSVYNHTLTTVKYTGTLAENHSFRDSETPVSMSYIAIGKK